MDFSDIEDDDFSCEAIKHKIVNKAIVYGFNGSGKSNFGLAIMDIVVQLTDHYNAFVQEICVSKFLHLPAFQRGGAEL